MNQDKCNIILAWLEQQGIDIDRNAFEQQFLILAHKKRGDVTTFHSFMEYTVEVVCEYVGMSREEFFENAHVRKRQYNTARSYFYWIVGAEKPYISLERVGEFMCKKNHATVIHGRKSLTQLMESDKSVYVHFKELCDIFAEGGFHGPKYKLSRLKPIWKMRESESLLLE